MKAFPANVTMPMLTVKLFQNVSLSPVILDSQFSIPFALGAYDSNLNFIDDFLLNRNWGTTGRAGYDHSKAARTLSEGIYGGILMDHYGHFLLESLSRYWAIKDARDDLPIVWHYRDRSNLLAWQREIFDLLKIDTKRFVYVDELTKLDSVYLPDAGYKIQTWGHPLYFASLCIFGANEIIPGKKVWLSRWRLDRNLGRITNEDEVEKKLVRKGWTIFHPETVSVMEQINMLKDAALISGFQSAAFHTMLFFNVKSRVVIFRRDRRPINHNYSTIAVNKLIEQDVHDVDLEYVSGDGSATSSCMKNPNEILEKLSAYE
jgi:hypothetical protein